MHKSIIKKYIKMKEEKMKRIGIWFTAIRAFSLTGSIIPVLLGGLLAIKDGRINPGLLIISILAMTFLQISVNLISDSDDFTNKVDTKDSFGSSGMITGGFLSPKQVLRAGIGFLILGCALGVYLTIQSGYIILVIGLLGALSSYFYSRKPFELKYNALGIPLVFLMFGPLPVIGSYYVQMQKFSLESLLISIPIGLLTTAILHANEIRDILHDGKSGIKTLSIKIGRKNAEVLYIVLIILSYIVIFVMIALQLLSLWSLVVLLSLPIAIKNIHKIINIENINTLDKETAMLQMLFGILMIVAILIN